ncbi:hypothetical protein J6590_071580 [Homalodisca vitripennis]|nr:hypothetical protein J6590_071580 [Homalodisca vitripennis]
MYDMFTPDSYTVRLCCPVLQNICPTIVTKLLAVQICLHQTAILSGSAVLFSRISVRQYSRNYSRYRYVYTRQLYCPPLLSCSPEYLSDNSHETTLGTDMFTPDSYTVRLCCPVLQNICPTIFTKLFSVQICLHQTAILSGSAVLFSEYLSDNIHETILGTDMFTQTAILSGSAVLFSRISVRQYSRNYSRYRYVYTRQLYCPALLSCSPEYLSDNIHETILGTDMFTPDSYTVRLCCPVLQNICPTIFTKLFSVQICYTRQLYCPALLSCSPEYLSDNIHETILGTDMFTPDSYTVRLCCPVLQNICPTIFTKLFSVQICLHQTAILSGSAVLFSRISVRQYSRNYSRYRYVYTRQLYCRSAVLFSRISVLQLSRNYSRYRYFTPDSYSPALLSCSPEYLSDNIHETILGTDMLHQTAILSGSAVLFSRITVRQYSRNYLW